MSDPRTPGARRYLDVATTGAFLLALALPTYDRLARPDAARDPRPENRSARPFPGVPRGVEDLFRWPDAFQDYFEDTLGYRDVLLGARNARLYAAGIAPTPALDVGAAGWICYRGNWAFEAHRGTRTLDREAMRAWIGSLEVRRKRLAALGIRFVFGLVPDKETIYPEVLPKTWDPVGPKLSDLFLEELQRRTEVDVVDLRPALYAARAEDRSERDDFVYFARGSHWSSRGAYAASQAIVEHLRATYPAMPPLERAGLQEFRGDAAGEDSWMRNLYVPWLLRPAIVLRPAGPWRVHPGPTLTGPGQTAVASWGAPDAPSVYFLHDSYGPFLQPFLAQSCRRLRSTWQSRVDGTIVEIERPDVVLMLRAERMLSLPPDVDDWPLELAVGAARAPEGALWRLAPDMPRPPRILGQAAFQPEADGLLWTTVQWTDRFLAELPAVPVAGRRLGYEYDIEAPRDGLLEVWLGTPGANEWSEEGASSVSLRAGANRGAVVLPTVPTTGRLLVRVGPVGTWRFRKLEVRDLGPAPSAAR